MASDRRGLGCPANVSDTVIISREMGCTRQELVGWLPRAVGDATFEVVGDRILIHPGQGQVQIELRQAPARRLGLLCLPVLRVTIQFSGLSQAAREQFLHRFDLATRRGGG
jgi:hypothetical protein